MTTAVLINNHNHAAWLPACLDSVLAQTPPPGEIIVYDDASTDHSLAVLERYVPRIRVIAGRCPNPSLPARIRQGLAIQEAFCHSAGDVLFLLDSDDLFTPGKIAHYLTAFSTTPRPALVQSPMLWINARSRKLRRYPEPFKHTANPLATAYARQDPDLFYPTSSLAFSREFLTHALPIDWSDGINLWSDTRLSLAALLHGPVVTLAEEQGAWRHHTSSDSARQSHARSYQLRQTFRRTEVFNQLARLSGRPTLSLWKNRRLYLQLLRFLTPSLVFYLYRRLILKIPAENPDIAHATESLH